MSEFLKAFVVEIPKPKEQTELVRFKQTIAENPDLAKLIEVWPRLSMEQRRAIDALIG